MLYIWYIYAHFYQYSEDVRAVFMIDHERSSTGYLGNRYAPVYDASQTGGSLSATYLV